MKKLKSFLALALVFALLIPQLTIAASNCNHNWTLVSEKETGITPETNQHKITLKMNMQCTKCKEKETRTSYRREAHTFTTDSATSTCIKVTKQYHRMKSVTKKSCRCGKKTQQTYTKDYEHQFSRTYNSSTGKYTYKCGCGYSYTSDF